MNFFLLILLLLSFNFLLSRYCAYLRIDKSIKEYLDALKSLNIKENSSIHYKTRLNKVSTTGYKLLIRIAIVFFPCLLVYAFSMFILGANFLISSSISLLVYITLIKANYFN